MATILTVTGCVDGTNVALVVDHLDRFTALDAPLIVDLHGARPGHRGTVDRLIAEFGDQCRSKDVAWVLVSGGDRAGGRPAPADAHVIRADSVAAALQHFVRDTYARRHMPLTGSAAHASSPILRTGS